MMSLVIDRIIDQIELIELCFFTYPPCLDPSRLQLMKLWQFFHFGKYIFYEPNEIPRIRLIFAEFFHFTRGYQLSLYQGSRGDL